MHKDQGKPWGLRDQEARKHFFDLVRDHLTRDEFDLMYELYRASPWWANLKARKVKQVGPVCEWCTRRPPRVLHHLTYSGLFAEKLDQVASICHVCHTDHHAEYPVSAFREWQRGAKNLFLLGHVVVGADVLDDLTTADLTSVQTVVTEIDQEADGQLEKEWQAFRPQLLI